MNCLEEGILRARMDEELEAVTSKEVDQHLTLCAACRERAAGISMQSKQVNSVLGTSSGAVNPVQAYDRYLQMSQERVENRNVLMQSWFGGWKRPAWAGVFAVSVAAFALSFAPARSWGQKILEMLRVQKVAVVPVDLTAMDQRGLQDPGKGLSRLISDSVIVTMKPGEPVAVPNLEAAAGAAGFPVRGLDELGTPAKILVNGELAFHMTLDRDRVEAVLDAAGRSDIQIPASVEGSTVAVHIPKMARLSYGNCSVAAESCVTFMQVPSPAISVPPGLDMAAVAEAGLQVVGMTAAEARAFSRTVDWSSTLVIPIPQRGSSSRMVPVDGVDGTLVELGPQGRFPASYTLIWIKNGIVYSVGGHGDSSRALAAAGSLN